MLRALLRGGPNEKWPTVTTRFRGAVRAHYASCGRRARGLASCHRLAPLFWRPAVDLRTRKSRPVPLDPGRPGVNGGNRSMSTGDARAGGLDAGCIDGRHSAAKRGNDDSRNEYGFAHIEGLHRFPRTRARTHRRAARWRMTPEQESPWSRRRKPRQVPQMQRAPA
jgi:hypothetical protein